MLAVLTVVVNVCSTSSLVVKTIRLLSALPEKLAGDPSGGLGGLLQLLYSLKEINFGIV